MQWKIWEPIETIVNVVKELVEIRSWNFSERDCLAGEPARETNLLPADVIARQEVAGDG